jgi:hypothetical protein
VVGHVYRYSVTGNVTSPAVAETNNEESTERTFTLGVFGNDACLDLQIQPRSGLCQPLRLPPFIPTPSVRSPSGGSSPVDLVLSREVCPYISLLSSRRYVSPLLPFFHLLKNKKNAPLPSLCPFSPPSSRSPLTSSFPQLTRFRVQRNRHESLSIAF